MNQTRKTMACPSCDNPVALKLGTWPFVESGLDNVILHGVEVFHCKQCGHSGPVLHDLDGLMSGLAQAIVVKPAPLTGSEIRYLRKHLAMPQGEFAKWLRVDTTTLSKWENDRSTPGQQSDLLIRFVTTIRDENLREKFKDQIEKVYKDSQNANRILLNAETREPEYTR